MVFVDVLGFELATLVVVAALLAYTSIMGLISFRRRGSEGLRDTLRSSAPPLGLMGGLAVGLGGWGEIAWPLPGAYNILFADVYLLLGIVLVSFAASVLILAKLAYTGLLAASVGAITVGYGVSAFQLGMTREPLVMLALFAGFGLVAMLTLPATLVADRMLSGEPWRASFRSSLGVARRTRVVSGMGRRAAQPMVPQATRENEKESGAEPEAPAGTRFPIPLYATGIVLGLATLAVLAGIVAGFLLSGTIPAHLASPP